MRCLNCSTVVADTDPCCLSCGARCTTPVRDQQVGVPIPYVGGTLMLVGMFGYVLLYVSANGHTHDREAIQELKTMAFVWGLVGFFLGLMVDAFLWSRGRPTNFGGRTTQSGGRGAGMSRTGTRQSFRRAGQRERPAEAGGSFVGAICRGFFRTIVGVVWAVVFFLLTGVITAIGTTIAAGNDPELQKQLAGQAGEKVGPWLMLGSIALVIVLAIVGWLPGARWKKR